jgi:hypothetical protein
VKVHSITDAIDRSVLELKDYEHRQVLTSALFRLMNLVQFSQNADYPDSYGVHVLLQY